MNRENRFRQVIDGIRNCFRRIRKAAQETCFGLHSESTQNIFAMGNFGSKENDKKAKNEEKYRHGHEKSSIKPDVDDVCTQMEALNIQGTESNDEEASVKDTFTAIHNSQTSQQNGTPMKEGAFYVEECCSYKDAYKQTQRHIEKAEREVNLLSPQNEQNCEPEPKKVKSSVTQGVHEKTHPHRSKKKSEFRKNAEEKVDRFFHSYPTLKYPYPLLEGKSILRSCPVLWKIHKRAKKLQKHSCVSRNRSDQVFRFTGKTEKHDACTQTDFKKKTWINRKTTIRPENDHINVVSALKVTKRSNLNEKYNADTVSKQTSVIRLSILGVLSRSGFVDSMKQKLKLTEIELEARDNERKQRVIRICQEKIEWYTDKFIRDVGPLPLEDERFAVLLQRFIVTITKSLARFDKTGKLQKEVSSGEASIFKSISKYLSPELEIIKKQIIQQHCELKYGKTSETENEEDSLDEKARGDINSRPCLGEIRAQQIATIIDEDKTLGINPVGHFDRGTEYRTDGEVVVEKCKRGSRKVLSEKPKKVKTRGIPNKHLRQASNLVYVNDAECVAKCETTNGTESTEIGDTNNSFEHFSELEESINYTSNEDYSFLDFEDVLLYADLDNMIGIDKEQSECTVDTRHLTNMPSQIIQGKKNDCDLLEEKYRPIHNKKRQRDNKKKRQKSKLKQTTLHFGLNLNNSADDPEMWSNDEEMWSNDEEDNLNNSPVIRYSTRPMMEEELDTLVSPRITFSQHPQMGGSHETCV